MLHKQVNPFVSIAVHHFYGPFYSASSIYLQLFFFMFFSSNERVPGKIILPRIDIFRVAFCVKKWNKTIQIKLFSWIFFRRNKSHLLKVGYISGLVHMIFLFVLKPFTWWQTCCIIICIMIAFQVARVRPTTKYFVNFYRGLANY